jgi:hypothetical protein
MLDKAGRATTRGRQLSLFKGRRQRGIAPPSAKEFSLHCMVADVLRRWLVDGWIWTHFPAGEARSAITGARLKRMGLNRGWPDFQFFHRDGACAFLELKRKGASLNEHQEAIAACLTLAAHRYNCVDNFDDAIVTLKNWGVLRAGIDVQ